MSSSLLRALLLLLLPVLGLVAAPAVRAEEPPVEEAARLTVTVAPERVVVGEPVQVTLAIRYRPQHFAQHAASLFRRPLDLEVQVSAPWLADLDGALPVPEAGDVAVSGNDAYVRLALNGEVASLRQTGPVTQAGAAWMLLTVTRTLLPTRAGALELTAPVLQYAYAPRIEENLMGERTAAVSTPVAIAGQPTTLVVEEPPAVGRPEGYAGAVGTFGVEARVGSPDVTVGEPFELTVILTGEGNLGLLEQPRLALDGFHVYGAKETPPSEPMPARRVVRYEVAVTAAAVREVPPIPFAYYDPASGYQVARSAALPLRVRPGEGGPSAAVDEGSPAEGVAATSPQAPEDPRRPSPVLLGLAVLAALLLVGGGAVLLLRVRPRRVVAAPGRAASRPSAAAAARPRPPPGPSREPSRQTLLAALRSEAATPASRYAAFAAFLAAYLGCGPGAVVGPSLAAALAARGVPAALTARTQDAMDALVAARYGGEAAGGLDEGLDEGLVAALVEALSPRP
ncbi:MAG: BatD family protein [Planctomycetota bacterium]|nr:BatD family protein [Planctomycetota bacterium]